MGSNNEKLPGQEMLGMDNKDALNFEATHPLPPKISREMEQGSALRPESDEQKGLLEKIRRLLRGKE